MKTLLLAGYRTHDEGEIALGLQRDENNVTLIDRRIGELRALGYGVVIVLAGQNADEQLRLCPRIAEAELVYDTNDHEANLATNMKAGLLACPGEACFVLPVEVAAPEWKYWAFIRGSWRTHIFHEPAAALQVSLKGAPPQLQYGFPLLVTRHGNRQIARADGLVSLHDARLKYLHLEYSEEANLALQEKPL